MLKNANEIISALDEKALLTRRQLSALVDCSLGNIIEAQRAGKLVGTEFKEGNVSTFKFSKEQLMNWRQNSGTQSSFARVTINLDTQEQVDKVKNLLSKAGIEFSLTLKKD